jgi:hypothetical protein
MAQAVTRRDEATGEGERLHQILSNLEIRVSFVEGSDGPYTVCTTSEPLFCFVRPTLEEINALVVDTLTNYVSTFSNVDSFHISTISIPVEESVIPVEKLKPLSIIKPTFSSRNSQGRQVEFA